MAEKTLWGYLKRGMKGKWSHGMRIECMLNKGVADVSYYHYGNGWIELKEVKQLPARPTTGIKIGRWHDLSQRYFLIRRRGWLFVRVNHPNRCYVLFHWSNLPPDTKPLWTWEDWLLEAHTVWISRVDWEEFSSIIKRPE